MDWSSGIQRFLERCSHCQCQCARSHPATGPSFPDTSFDFKLFSLSRSTTNPNSVSLIGQTSIRCTRAAISFASLCALLHITRVFIRFFSSRPCRSFGKFGLRWQRPALCLFGRLFLFYPSLFFSLSLYSFVLSGCEGHPCVREVPVQTHVSLDLISSEQRSVLNPASQ